MQPRTQIDNRKLSLAVAVFAVLAVMVLCLDVRAIAQQPMTSQGADQTQSNPAPPPAQMAAGQGASQQGMQGSETVHVVVGHSLLIRTPTRVKRLLTGNPAVIESVVTSPEELVITAKEPGSSSLMLWDENGRNRILDVYSDLDVSGLRSSLEESFPQTNVEVQTDGDKLMLVGTVPNKDVADQITKMASGFSKDVVDGLHIAAPPRQKQIMLHVRFAEADRNKMQQWGFNLFSTGAANTIGTISTQQYGPLSLQQLQSGGGSTNTQFNFSNLLNIFIFRPDINLGATIQALEEKQVLTILAEPNLMALSGQTARFLAGGEFPYPVVQSVGTVGATGAITVVFKPYGVKLEFVGTIEDDGAIRLKVAPEVSSLDYSNAIVLQGFTMPAIQTRHAETEIELKDGQSFGIAGLLDQRTTIQLSKIPGIGDVPILGELFKSRNVQLTNTELLVLVTPTIVDPVGGQPEPPQVQVSYPTKTLDTGSFDKGLPDGVKSPGTAK